MWEHDCRNGDQMWLSGRSFNFALSNQRGDTFAKFNPMANGVARNYMRQSKPKETFVRAYQLFVHAMDSRAVATRRGVYAVRVVRLSHIVPSPIVLK
jgi:hypothetical protein